MIFLIAAIVIALVIALVVTKLQTTSATPADVNQTSVTAEASEENAPPSDCCGAHEVCESDTLLSSSDQIEYYSDEELDRFRYYREEQYTPADIEEFREVLYTLMEREVANWMKSLQLRQINPPVIIREEALMIVADRRFRNGTEA